jgi:radical SAM protein with 4Fe4S-binding SPASM domain
MFDSGVMGVSVSLDGEKEVHDAIRKTVGRSSKSSYEAAIRAIELSRASTLKTAVITQVHKRNIYDLEKMYHRIVSLGVDLWQVQIAMPLGRLLEVEYEYLIEPEQIAYLTEEIARFIQEKGVAIAVADNIGYYDRHEPVLRGSLKGQGSFWIGCLAGCRVVGICSNGDVKGCPSHPLSFVAGNIRKTPFADIWADRGRFAYNTEWKEELLEAECATCAFGNACRGGCKSLAFAVTGNTSFNPFCLSRVSGEF